MKPSRYQGARSSSRFVISSGLLKKQSETGRAISEVLHVLVGPLPIFLDQCLRIRDAFAIF
jgi:hypothetical protein